MTSTPMPPRRRTPEALDEETLRRKAAGERMKELRAKAKLTQDLAAKAADMPIITLQKWEQGVNSPQMGDLAVLANLYGQPEQAFFEAPGSFVRSPDLTKITPVLVVTHPAAELDTDLAGNLIAWVDQINNEYRRRRELEKKRRDNATDSSRRK